MGGSVGTTYLGPFFQHQLGPLVIMSADTRMSKMASSFRWVGTGLGWLPPLGPDGPLPLPGSLSPPPLCSSLGGLRQSDFLHSSRLIPESKCQEASAEATKLLMTWPGRSQTICLILFYWSSRSLNKGYSYLREGEFYSTSQ